MVILSAVCLTAFACAGRGGSRAPEDDTWSFRVEGETLEQAAADTAGAVPAAAVETANAPIEVIRSDSAAAEGSAESAALIPGFRVQIFSSSTAAGAKLAADEARYRLNDRTYIDPSGGLYRVQAGDCLTREEAEALREKCRRSGYKDAFIVTAQITVTRSP